MTVLAYKGGILAADRLGLRAGLKTLAHKIHSVPGGWLAGAGTTASVLEMVEWYRAGAKKNDMPKRQYTDDSDLLILLNHDGAFTIERGAFPVPMRGDYISIGSGQDFAAMAMHLGRSAIEAVTLASELCYSCGAGVDYVSMDATCIRDGITGKPLEALRV